jgi:hypothetical protein
MDKERIKQICIEKIQNQIAELKELMQDVQRSSNQESKSTAGDKHDTARAQVQIEVERIGNQLKIVEEMYRDLGRILHIKNDQIFAGSFVETTCGDFYLSVGLGKLTQGNFSFFAVSVNSPISLAMKFLKLGDEFKLPNGSSCIINRIW